MENYEIQTLRGSIMQVLESTDIIESSKAIDTVIGRIELLQDRIKKLIEFSKLPYYLQIVQNGLDDYKTIYYEKIPSSTQIEIITNPSGFLFDDYYLEQLYSAIEKFIELQNNEINNLKMYPAKLRRMQNVMNKIELAKEKTIEITPNTNNGLKEFILKNYDKITLESQEYIKLVQNKINNP